MRNNAIEDNIKKILEENFAHVDKFDTEKGGLYVETTDDPRGWMLGDKTRKIYKVPNLLAKGMTIVGITSNSDNGSEIKVSVYNPGDIGRMLLSKNDDVGSSIEYAQIEGSGPIELVAKIGEHVLIEPLIRGNWIRMHIFPGNNIVEIIKSEKSERAELDFDKIIENILSEM